MMKKGINESANVSIFLKPPPIQENAISCTGPLGISEHTPIGRLNVGKSDAKRGHYKLKIITYKYGGGGAQDGAQDGPDNLQRRPTSKAGTDASTLNHATLESTLTDYEITFHHPVPDYVTQQNQHPDAGFVTRTSTKTGQIKQQIQLDGRVIRKMVKIDPNNERMNKYLVTSHPDGSVNVPDQPYATKRVEDIKSRPAELDVNGKRLYYPNGIKNLPYVESAVENTAAAVCQEILSSHLVSTSTPDSQKPVSPLVLGGDHTQGLATNVGARLAAVTKALLSTDEKEGIALALPPGMAREVALADVQKSAETLLTQTSQPSILRAARSLGKAIADLVDMRVFQQIRNEQLYLDVKSEMASQDTLSTPQKFHEAIAHKRQQRLHSLEDGGILSMRELKKFMGTIHEFWFDAHGDWNTEVTSTSKNSHGMPLAFASGHGVLSNILGTACLELDPENTHTFGTRDTDAAERKLMIEVGVDINRSKEIQDAGRRLTHDALSSEELLAHQREWGLAQLFNEKCESICMKVRAETGREAQFIVSYDGDGIHATGDALDGTISNTGDMNTKGFAATGTPVGKGGPRAGHALKAVEGLHTKYKVLAYDFSEFNPNLGIEENVNLSVKDKLALLKKNPREDGSVEATREVSLAFIKSIYARQRAPVPRTSSNREGQ